MAGASGAEVRWAFVSESTAGTTPSTPSFTVASFNNMVFRATPNTEVLRQNFANRRASAVSRSGYNVTGTGSGNLIYGVYDDLLASLLQGSWASDVLKDTTSGRSTFTFESTIPAGAGGTDTYFRYRGIEGVGASLSLTAGENAAFEMEFLGVGSDDGTTSAIAGASYTDPTNNAVLGSGADVGFFTINNTALSPQAMTVPCMRSATVNFNMEAKDPQQQIGSDDLCGIRRGAASPTVTGEFYIDDGFRQIYNAARDGDALTLSIPLGSVSGSKYTIEFPNAELLVADNEISGDDAFQTFTIQGLYDTSEDCAVKITRAIS